MHKLYLYTLKKRRKLKLKVFQGFLSCFRYPIRVPRIENRVPRIRENRSLQLHTGYLTFSLKKTGFNNICGFYFLDTV